MSPRPVDDARHRSFLAGALSLLLTLLCLGWVSPIAQADTEQLSVRFTSMSPSAITDSGDLTLTGTITNNSSETHTAPVVKLWRDRSPITNSDALALLLDNDDSPELSDVVTSSEASVTLGDLAPGASADFSVKASFTSGDDPLSLTSTDCAYLVGVRVDKADGSQLGGARTFIASPGATTWNATTVAELASTPSYVGTDAGKPIFTDDHLAAEIAPDGRLSQLATLADQEAVSSVIDPLLVDELTSMAAGYTVRDTSGNDSPGAGQQAAADFLNRLTTIAHNSRSYRGLYGMLAVNAASSASRNDLLTTAAQRSASSELLGALRLAVTATDANVTNEELDFLSSVSPSVVLATGIDVSSPVQEFRTDNDDDQSGTDQASTTLTVVPVNTSMADAGPSPEPNDDLVHRVGHLQSEQLLRAVAHGNSVHLVTDGEAARAELAGATGRKRVSLSELMAGVDASPLRNGNNQQSTTSDGLGRAEDNARSGLEAYRSLTGENAGIDADLLVARAWSGSFTDGTAAQNYLNAAMATVERSLRSGGVQIHISEKLVVPNKTTSLPISVTNTMSMPVKVQVHFDSDNSSRISIADTEVIQLGPGESATVRISPEVNAAGSVQMDAMVMTVGERPHQLGASVRFTVDAQNTGNIGWIIIIASGVVMLGATALRVRQVRRERARKHTPADDDPDVPFDPRPLDD